MCGIIGISAENNVAEEIYESLLMLPLGSQTTMPAASCPLCCNMSRDS